MSETHPLCAVNEQGWGIEAVFARQGDRYGHAIIAVTPQRRWLMLQSHEWGDDEATVPSPWPPSPPLQQISFEDRPAGGRVALLVGMAGKSHWSLAVHAAPAQQQLTFEAACRVQQPPDSLGSTYVQLVPLSASTTDRGQRLAWSPLPQAPHFGGSADFAIQAEIPEGQSHCDGHQWRVAPTPRRTAPPYTVSWKYILLMQMPAAAKSERSG